MKILFWNKIKHIIDVVNIAKYENLACIPQDEKVIQFLKENGHYITETKYDGNIAIYLASYNDHRDIGYYLSKNKHNYCAYFIDIEEYDKWNEKSNINK